VSDLLLRRVIEGRAAAEAPDARLRRAHSRAYCRHSVWMVMTAGPAPEDRDRAAGRSGHNKLFFAQAAILASGGETCATMLRLPMRRNSRPRRSIE
jgi:hypothetical protein